MFQLFKHIINTYAMLDTQSIFEISFFTFPPKPVNEPCCKYYFVVMYYFDLSQNYAI